MKKLIVAFILLLVSVNANASSLERISHQSIQAFIGHMVKTSKYTRAELEAIFAKVQYLPTAVDKMNHPSEKKPWKRYRKILVTDKRIKEGVAYWHKHQAVLAQAQKKFGVPASIIVSIIGVETSYGTNQGSYNEMSVLSTFAFNYPKRAKFFKKELEKYLLLARQQQLPVLKVEGSYAGALGIPQFMPSTYRHYAVAYAGSKKKINLMNNDNDAIYSVANYLRRHHWQTGKPVAKQMKTGGEAGLDNWKKYKNFKVIMKYNTSSQYAMAVFQLSQAIKKQHSEKLSSYGVTS